MTNLWEYRIERKDGYREEAILLEKKTILLWIGDRGYGLFDCAVGPMVRLKKVLILVEVDFFPRVVSLGLKPVFQSFSTLVETFSERSYRSI